jgi:hypothetical protein
MKLGGTITFVFRAHILNHQAEKEDSVVYATSDDVFT